MRVFIFALCLCLLVTAGIAWNYIYINEACDRLLESLDALPSVDDEACPSAIEHFSKAWQAEIKLFSLSVSYALTDRVSEQADVLLACARCGDRFGFQATLALLRDAIDDLRRFEQISILNLL